jgi:energy-coupling factor transporter transmembrane protein EcfT
MSEEATIILNAQRARGVRIKSIIDKFKALIPVLVPLTIGSLERMNTIAMSISARGYGAPIKPTELKEIKMSIRDYIAISVIAISLIGAVYIWLLHGDLNYIKQANSFANLFVLPL